MQHPNIAAAIQPVVEIFEALNITYYIGGSVASSIYGMARMTMDVDMVADIQPHHVDLLVQQLESAYYIDDHMIHDAISRQASFNLVHLETMLKVDVFIFKDTPYHRAALQRCRKDKLDAGQDTTEFYFVSAEDIVLSKLDWYRMGGEVSERQWKDILGVLKVQWPTLDFTYLEHWATKLQMQDLLHRAFDEAVGERN
ncbi:MAG: hypothetical protein GVY30_11215 [Chloroflexi bacterium]|jgi:hypothetical protein|nr:hypothetical protein [Chloroflexota bacterium]